MIISHLEYQSQLIFLSEEKYSQLLAPFRKLFKHKLNLNQYMPNAILYTNLLYNFCSLYEIKIQSIFINLIYLLNDITLAGLTTKIRVK